MNQHLFQKSLSLSAPPKEATPHLQALWHDANNNWEAAHALIQDEPDLLASRIHAYLHRKEGDPFNAGYWYRRAGVQPFAGSLQQEWEALVAACCTPN